MITHWFKATLTQRSLMILFFLGIIFTFPFLSAQNAHAQAVYIDKGEEEPKPRWLVLPYAFATESLGFSYGIGGGGAGYYQKQSSFAAAVLGSTNGAGAIYLYSKDYHAPQWERLFLDTFITVGKMPNQRSYTDGNPGFVGERAGSNDSSKDNYTQADGWDNRVDFNFHYVLPIAHGEFDVISRYTMDHGLLDEGASGAESWNPLESGKTSFHVSPFFRERTLEFDSGNNETMTNGFEFELKRDNTDLPINPSIGSVQSIGFAQDYGWFNSTDSWTSVEAEFEKYFSLGDSKWARQRIIALDAWTSYSPSWEEEFDGVTRTVSHRTPEFNGATLGGLYRMRAFPSFRFNDKAAIYYSAEYRYTLRKNPVENIRWLDFLKMDWLQVVGFAEAGRVSPEWNMAELHKDMKVDGGIGFRAMFAKAVFRCDFAFSDEDTGIWFMGGHPF